MVDGHWLRSTIEDVDARGFDTFTFYGPCRSNSNHCTGDKSRALVTFYSK